MGQQRPACKGFADGILGECITAWTEHSSSLVKATRGQRDVRRDHNVVRRDMLHNPVIDGIELPFDNHKFVPLPLGNANPRIGDDRDMETVSLRYAVHFLPYWAAIGIDEYLKHLGTFLPSASPTWQIAQIWCTRFCIRIEPLGVSVQPQGDRVIGLLLRRGNSVLA
jgi:hypothetical protein